MRKSKFKPKFSKSHLGSNAQFFILSVLVLVSSCGVEDRSNEKLSGNSVSSHNSETASLLQFDSAYHVRGSAPYSYIEAERYMSVAGKFSTGSV